MAKLEIPSIVVHSGSPSVPGVNMDRSPRQTPQLRKQKSSLDDGDSGTSGCIHHSKFESTGPPSNNTNNNNNTSSQNPSKPENLSGSGSNNKPGSPGGGSPKSDDIDRTPSGPQPQLSRSRSNAKMKMLTRSHAMREATSPPPDPAAVTSSGSSAVSTSTNAQASVSALSNGTGKSNGQASKALNNNGNGNNHHSSYNNSGNGNNNNNNNSKTKNGNHKNNKDQNNMSSNKSNHRQQNKNFIFISSPQEAWGGLLNRDPTNDSHYEGASKADLDGFIAQQMSTKNRQLLMRIEEELVGLLKEERMVYFRFPQMTSFHRMLVHRAASYFGMDHNLDSSGSCVVVSRNRNSRLPERNFLQIMRDVKGLHGRAYSSEEPRKSILKRDFASFEDNHLKSDEKQLSLESRRSKSFEEREEEYERARRRIFSRDDSADSCHRNSDSNQDSMEDVRWSECATWSGDEPEPPGRYLRPNDRNPRLLKTESYEGRDAFKGNSGRSAVSKSYSFGGYTGNGGNNGKVGSNHGQTFSNLQRGDSNASSISSGSRMLAKQDSGSSGSSRLSPSSSGYKSQSQQSDATLSATPSPTATPLSLLPMSSQGSQDTLSPEPPAISWPLPNNIPSGSVLINPATGQPICNSDGSVYRFDPENPLTLAVPHRPDRSDRPEQSESPAKATGSATNSEKENDKDTNKKELDQGRASQSASTAPQTSSKPSPDSSKAASSKSSAGGSGGSHSESKEERRPPGPAHTNDRKDASKEVAPSAPSSLALPAGPDRPDGSGRGMASAATSPMLVASPQRQPGGPGGLGGQPPTQAGQPIVLGGPGGAGYAMAPSPMVSMPVVPGQVQYPVPQFHNGTYTYSTGPAPGPDGQTYVNGYTTSVPYAVASYPVGVDPTTGAYVSPPQTGQALPTAPPPPGGPVPAPPPCCVPGYPCPYGAPGIAAAPHAPPHGGYDQRAVEAGAPGVAEMTTYMMGMSLAGPGAVDQRAGGDGSTVPGRADGQSPQQGPGAPPGPPQTPLMVAGTGSYYWGHQLSSHSQAYPSTVMYYYPPNNVQSPPSSSGVAATPVSGNANNSSYGNRGTSPSSTNNRESNSNKSNSNSSASTSSTGGNNRNSYNRNVAASYAKGAAIYQPPIYSMANLQMPPQAQDRSVINGYPNDCVPVGGPQQQVVYTVSSMHSSTVPTQSYQPAVYSNASAASSSNLTYYQGVQGAGDAASQAQGQQLVPVNPYAAPQGYMPAPGTPPLTPQGYPYVYGMYSQTANGPGGPASPATYSNVGPHQSPMIPRMMRPNLVVGGVQSSPPPRNLGPKGFPRGQSPSGRKDQSGSGDNVRFSQPYSVPMYSIASRYMSGDMRYMPGRLPFSIPPNTYRAIRPFQTSYYPRPHSQPSGEALGLNRPPRVRKPTSPPRSPARGPFVGRDFKGFSKPPAVMRTS